MDGTRRRLPACRPQQATHAIRARCLRVHPTRGPTCCRAPRSFHRKAEPPCEFHHTADPISSYFGTLAPCRPAHIRIARTQPGGPGEAKQRRGHRRAWSPEESGHARNPTTRATGSTDSASPERLGIALAYHLPRFSYNFREAPSIPLFCVLTTCDFIDGTRGCTRRIPFPIRKTLWKRRWRPRPRAKTALASGD